MTWPEITGHQRGIPMVQAAPKSPYGRRILCLVFLASNLQGDIIAGLHPPGLNLKRLMNMRSRSPGRSSVLRSDGGTPTDPVMDDKWPVTAD
jgi:hypothetical protein